MFALLQILSFTSGLFHYHSLKAKWMSSQTRQVTEIKHMGNICSRQRCLNNLLPLVKKTKYSICPHDKFIIQFTTLWHLELFPIAFYILIFSMSSTYTFSLNDQHSTLKKNVQLSYISWRILKLILGSQKEYSSISVLLINLQYCPGEKMREWQHACGCHSSPNSYRHQLTLKNYFPIICLYSHLSCFPLSKSDLCIDKWASVIKFR